MHDLPIMPGQASNFAVEADALFFTITALTIVFTAIVCILLAFFTYKYRRGAKADRSRPVDHNTMMELSWAIGPLFLAVGIFVWSAKIYTQMYGQAPKDALEVYVVGKQWMWHLQHPNGIRENAELHLPVGRPVKLMMISQDVIHSFFVPEFRIKRDVIPGNYTSVWFTPTKAGKYHIFCAEYCGTQHSEMTGYVYVMEPAEYQQWVDSKGQRTTSTQPVATTMAGKGKAIYDQQGCGNCHDTDGMARAPSLAGLYGSQVKLKNKQIVKADEAYLRKSILDPDEVVADTFPQIMPSYRGQITEDQVLQLIAYIKSISRNPVNETGKTVPATSAPESGASTSASTSGTVVRKPS